MADEAASAAGESRAENPAPSVQHEAGLPPLTAEGLLLLLSCIIVWGVTAVALKVATRPPHGFDPVFVQGLRFLIVAPIFVAAVALRDPGALRLTRADIARYALFGLFAVGFGETLQAVALGYTSVANLTLLSHGTISLFTAIWAFALYRQPLSRAGWVGAIIAFVGVGIVATTGAGGLRFSGVSWKGDAIALARSVIHSCYLLQLARWLRHRSVLQVTVYNCVFGALWLLPYVLWKAPGFAWENVPPLAWWSLAWTIGPTTLYGFLAWNYGMRRVGAVAATNLFYLMPVSASVAAWLLLGEPITAGQILGGIVIIAGIVLLRWDALRVAGLRVPSLPWKR